MKDLAIQKIEQQQGKEGTAVWMVGEQLKDICRHEPKSAELIAQDLDVAELSLVNAEKKIKAYADAHKTGNFACVPPSEADRILREFFGLTVLDNNEPAADETQKPHIIDLADFFK